MGVGRSVFKSATGLSSARWPILLFPASFSPFPAASLRSGEDPGREVEKIIGTHGVQEDIIVIFCKQIMVRLIQQPARLFG